jgi:hypothetical protein
MAMASLQLLDRRKTSLECGATGKNRDSYATAVAPPPQALTTPEKLRALL